MAGPLISADGRWWWDGTQWRSRLVEGELDLFWFTTTPEWQSRVLLMGLISLIPIAGIIAVNGWTLAGADMLRQSWRELPRPGFQYLERGVAPFLVGLVFGLVAFVTTAILVAVAVALVLTKQSLLPLSFGLALVVALLAVAWWAFNLYCLPALLVVSDQMGIEAALDPRRIWRVARENHDASLRAALIYLVASLAIVVITIPLSVIPLGGLLAGLALPAVFAMLAPSVAKMRIAPAPARLN